jgi:uncharacterized protein (TIGR04255 family)
MKKNHKKQVFPIEKKLPSYKSPPVTEVVCGIRYDPPQNFTLPHIGLLWNKFRGDYPEVQHAAPLVSVHGELLLDKVTGAPLPRIWFINRQGNQLIQFQPDRIYFNWRQREDTYPRYEYVILKFEEVLETLQAFFEEFQLGEFTPVECELTYINHIPKKAEHELGEELERIFKDFLWNQPPRFLPNPVDISWNLKFALPEKRGGLTATIKRAKLIEGNVPIFVLDFTARGIGISKDRAGIRDWFDTAHEWIVWGFADLTTDTIQKEEWERENV